MVLTMPSKCGGSSITPRFVLTAAHCNDKLAQRTTDCWFGMHFIDFNNLNGERFKVVQYIQHPSFHPDPTSKRNFKFDIGILKLETAVVYRPLYTTFVCLAKPSDTDLIDGSYESEMAGFGFAMVWIHELGIMMKGNQLERFEFVLPEGYQDEYFDVFLAKVFIKDDLDATKKIATMLDPGKSFEWFDEVKSTGTNYKVQV